MSVIVFKMFWMLTVAGGSVAGYFVGLKHAKKNIERMEQQQLFAKRIREVFEVAQGN